MNSLIFKSNFDWSITERKFCLFVPNFHRKKYVEYTLAQIETVVPKEDWIIIIGNDNCDDNFEHLADRNIFYFSLLSSNDSERNGCFIRNYFIKRVRSKVIAQKDPEVIVCGDFIKNWLEITQCQRAGRIKVLDTNVTSECFKRYDMFPLQLVCDMKITPYMSSDARVIQHCAIAPAGVVFTNYFHYLYAAPTELLKKLRGYDETFIKFGYEDSDIFCRLFADQNAIWPNYNITACHLYHSGNKISGDLEKMTTLFKSKDTNQVVRNSLEWGEGNS